MADVVVEGDDDSVQLVSTLMHRISWAWCRSLRGRRYGSASACIYVFEIHKAAANVPKAAPASPGNLGHHE